MWFFAVVLCRDNIMLCGGDVVERYGARSGIQLGLEIRYEFAETIMNHNLGISWCVGDD